MIVGFWVIFPTPRIAASGGLIMGVKKITLYIPRFVMVNVPPERSSFVSLPCLAFWASSFIAVFISFSDFWSALWITGTIRPWGAATATPMLMSSKILILLSSRVELMSECSFRALAAALTMMVV